MKNKRFSSYESREMCKWWCFLEFVKLIFFFVAIFIEDKATPIVFLFWILAFLTALSWYKSFPVFKEITNFLLIEDEEDTRKYLLKIRNILILLSFLDLLPFIPLIQAALRYKYYKLEDHTIFIFQEIRDKYRQKFTTY
ncbi:hypothetical protein [Candidatus Mycoplasma haematohominis]|uniref:Uncharacterized protein n=1 Tax=Candidatus Mycoplasma haematohominis TaxID=1494318 RepID=A0A478FQW4_9MOLU|nr:hypothetical protein [Candidatus Mycoplasma haemohominis]GCE63344.1 hypothetical protein MHSWG343_03330 [Candidatus Mycoplasma haemohominis]